MSDRDGTIALADVWLNHICRRDRDVAARVYQHLILSLLPPRIMVMKWYDLCIKCINISIGVAGLRAKRSKRTSFTGHGKVERNRHRLHNKSLKESAFGIRNERTLESSAEKSKQTTNFIIKSSLKCNLLSGRAAIYIHHSEHYNMQEHITSCLELAWDRRFPQLRFRLQSISSLIRICGIWSSEVGGNSHYQLIE